MQNSIRRKHTARVIRPLGVVVVQYSGHPTLVSRCTTNRGDIMSLTYYDEAFQPHPRTYIYVHVHLRPTYVNHVLLQTCRMYQLGSAAKAA
jgi:hypothetical protein